VKDLVAQTSGSGDVTQAPRDLTALPVPEEPEAVKLYSAILVTLTDETKAMLLSAGGASANAKL
jgi:hypothetical protein